jgi:hypothetical protein
LIYRFYLLATCEKPTERRRGLDVSQVQPQAAAKKTKRRGRPRRRPLRKESLVRAAKVELGRMAQLSPSECPINISTLAKRKGISRQALYDNGLKPVVDEFAELQRKNWKIKTEAAALRRPLEVRNEELEKAIAELEAKLDALIEKFVTIEYNARMHGLDADKLYEPMPPPNREVLSFKRGRKGGRRNK